MNVVAVAVVVVVVLLPLQQPVSHSSIPASAPRGIFNYCCYFVIIERAKERHTLSIFSSLRARTQPFKSEDVGY